MASEPPRQTPLDVPRLKWSRSSRFAVGETILGLTVYALLKWLHRSGVLFPGLPHYAFMAVVLGGLLLLALAAHLIEGRLAAKKKGTL
jgi:hypothetical protein